MNVAIDYRTGFIRTPIKRRRSKPRRGEVHDPAFVAWMHLQGCLIEGKGGHVCSGPITFHHVRFCGSPKDDHRGLALCQGGHLHDFGADSIEHGKAQFEETFGICIEDCIQEYFAQYQLETGSVPLNRAPSEVPFASEAGLTRRRMLAEELYGGMGETC